MTTYVPGGCAAYAAPHVLVLAAGDALDRVVELARSSAAPSVLGVIGALSGGDLAALPDFACVLRDGDRLRAVVRGGFEVESGRWRLTGADAAPWSEQVVPAEVAGAAGAAGIAVRPTSGPAPSGALRLPLQDGVVLAAEVVWSAASSAAPGTTPDLTPDRTAGVASDVAAITQPPLLVSDPPPAAPPASRTSPPGPVEPAEPADHEDQSDRSDHDGLTVTAAQLGLAVTSPPVPGGLSSSVPVQPPAVPGPVAVLQVSGKPDLVVHRTVLIGRSPQPQRSGSAALPALVVVDDPYVSGTHLEVIRREAMVLVIDRSSNGTLVKLPGRVAERLVKGVATPVVDGTLLTLSDRVTATVRIRSAGAAPSAPPPGPPGAPYGGGFGGVSW